MIGIWAVAEARNAVSHGSEVSFVFGAYDLNATSPNGQIGLQMGAYW